MNFLFIGQKESKKNSFKNVPSRQIKPIYCFEIK